MRAQQKVEGATYAAKLVEGPSHMRIFNELS